MIKDDEVGNGRLKRNTGRFGLENLKENDHVQGLGEERKIIKYVLEK